MKRRPRSRAISPAHVGSIPSKTGRPRSLRGSTPTQPSSAARSRNAAKPSFGAVFWFNAKSMAASSGIPLHDPLDLRRRHEAPLPQGTCHDVQVVHLEPIRRAAWVVTPRHKHDVAVPHRHRLIERSVVGVDPLDGEIVLVVPVARIGGPVAARREHLRHEKAVAKVLVFHGYVVDVTRVEPLPRCVSVMPSGPMRLASCPPFPGAEQTAITQSVSATAFHSTPFGR